MTDDVEIRRRRAIYRALHRGTKEMDHLVGRFASARVAGMASGDLEHFERFLALPDPLLQAWFFAHSEPLAEFSMLVIELRRFHGLTEAAAPSKN